MARLVAVTEVDASGRRPSVVTAPSAAGSWPEHAARHAEVSALDATTDEIEVMDSAEYLARFHPPSRATTDCPAHPAQPCDILLDGEVIGEGRWPRIIGFIELD